MVCQRIYSCLRAWSIAQLSGGPSNHSVERIEHQSRRAMKKQERADTRSNNDKLQVSLSTPSSSSTSVQGVEEMLPLLEQLSKRQKLANGLEMLKLEMQTLSWLPEDERSDAQQRILKKMKELQEDS